MWVARDENGELALFNKKPIRGKYHQWNVIANQDEEGKYILNYDWFLIDEKLFPNLEWEDEPLEVELVIKKG